MSLRDEAIVSDVYIAINRRFLALSPAMDLKCYFLDDPRGKQIEVKKNTLDGIDFVPKDADTLMRDLEAARTGGDKAFEKGSSKPVDFQAHWAHSASLLATKGIGYREPWRYTLTDHELRISDARPSLLKAPEMDQQFSGYFAEAFNMNLRALHVGVGFGSEPKDNVCNVHIDELGIEMVDESGNLSVTPVVGAHTFSELILKSIIPVPEWVKTNVDLHVLSPSMGFSRLGASVHLYKTPKFRVTLSASCGFTSCDNVDWGGFLSIDKLKTLDLWKQINPTLSVSGEFEFLGGSRSKRHPRR